MGDARQRVLALEPLPERALGIGAACCDEGRVMHSVTRSLAMPTLQAARHFSTSALRPHCGFGRAARREGSGEHTGPIDMRQELRIIPSSASSPTPSCSNLPASSCRSLALQEHHLPPGSTSECHCPSSAGRSMPRRVVVDSALDLDAVALAAAEPAQMLLRGAWERNLFPAREQNGLELLGNIFPHDWAVAVTLEIGAQSIRIARANGASLVGVHCPLLEAVEDAEETLRLLIVRKVKERVSDVL
mmetsp:Transcript_26022/g.67921  ORF Transcript_26022/g.67921 Transcript_26022/m.67921 type:complete len:246 (-) Transcript_26022:209-946(-)